VAPFVYCLALIGGPGTRLVVMVDWVCLKLNHVSVSVSVTEAGRETTELLQAIKMDTHITAKCTRQYIRTYIHTYTDLMEFSLTITSQVDVESSL
jgi:hypothetical protein